MYQATHFAFESAKGCEVVLQDVFTKCACQRTCLGYCYFVVWCMFSNTHRERGRGTRDCGGCRGLQRSATAASQAALVWPPMRRRCSKRLTRPPMPSKSERVTLRTSPQCALGSSPPPFTRRVDAWSLSTERTCTAERLSTLATKIRRPPNEKATEL
eukprot:586638-Amphidinium_carterae.1